MKKYLPTSHTFGINSASKGFTLIELMVVVTIIAFLSVIGIVAFSNAQAQARDARRRADIDAIATAMEANRDPVNGTYQNWTTTGIYANNKVPTDPVDTTNGATGTAYAGTNYGYGIKTANSTTKFVTCAVLEKKNGNASTADTTLFSFTSASGDTATMYCRTNQQ